MDIVALNGVPLNRVGWTLPILFDGNHCFVYGSAPSQGFSLSDLEAMNLSHQVAMVDPVSLEEVLPFQKYEVASDANWDALGADLYAIYFERGKLQNLGLRTDTIIQGRGIRLNFVDQSRYSGFVACIATRETLTEILADAFSRIEILTRGVLARRINSHDPFQNVETDHATELSGALYDSAYDKRSGGRAIAYRGLAIQLGPSCHLFEEWLPRATKKWRLVSDVDVWQKRIHSIRHSLLSGQAPYAKLEPDHLRLRNSASIDSDEKSNIPEQSADPAAPPYNIKDYKHG